MEAVHLLVPVLYINRDPFTGFTESTSAKDHIDVSGPRTALDPCIPTAVTITSLLVISTVAVMLLMFA